MKNAHTWYQGLILVTAYIMFNSVCAIDNPDAPVLISKFKVDEKVYLKAIENPANGTRDTIRAYYEYKIFLDKKLNKTYSNLKSKLTPKRQKELKISQRNWIKFRDEEFKFINNNWNRSGFGSSFAISRGDYSSAIIKNRLMQLFHYASNYL